MFTNEYIEKAIKAKEIQGLWKQKVGDWVVDYNYMTPTLLDKKIEGINKPITVIGWLPTLEDLFGVADWGHYSINKNIGDHGYYYGKENLFGEIKYPGETFSSLKEMVLAVVMEINYNKSWNGEEWEEINGS